MKFHFHLIFIYLISKILCEEDFYQLLGVTKDATQKEIKKAFRTLSLKYHPDRNPGNKEAHDRYIKINRAHEVLTDPEKKEIYDIYGEEGLNREQNIMNEGKERGPDAHIEIPVTLEDLYNGAKRSFNMEKNVICSRCHGTGGKLGKTKQCPKCNGRGFVTQVINMMGFQMQTQQPCGKCQGKGIVFSEKCDHCNGRKVVKETKNIEIEIEKGMRNKQNIVFARESEQYPGKIPGDLIVTLSQKKHKFFKKRHGDNLMADIELNLKEALLGYNKKITHLDKREFYVESKDVTQPFQERVITGEGMPVHKFPSQKGDLILTFKVNLPKTLNQEEKDLIKEIFQD
jgi:DnaJ-class molecular chaperone